MPTPKIIWQEGAIYHITTRGNHKEAIFKDEDDFEAYLEHIDENLRYYSHLNYELIAYCLMSNHVHLMIKTEKEPLTSIMRRLNSKYTKYFNKKYDYVGHLFQGRYFAEIINNREHLLDVSRYIHLNPVKAKIVSNPKDYKWSSYSRFIETYDNRNNENKDRNNENKDRNNENKDRNTDDRNTDDRNKGRYGDKKYNDDVIKYKSNEVKDKNITKKGQNSNIKLNKNNIVNPNIVLDYFSCKERYKEFVELSLK
ncbi:hypothetical protein SDC9_57064 [bioreactor metagenome]|uniref:Transposase IS200-like domain-containing protein n=1 Tax=bioreactor metagenome TaxID=1076179 RepID=A0A644X3K3_9ZZZZ